MPVSPESLPGFVGFLVAGVPLTRLRFGTCGHVVLQHQGAIAGHVPVVAPYLGDERIVTVEQALRDTLRVRDAGGLVRGIEVTHSVEYGTPIHHGRYLDRATAQQLGMRSSLTRNCSHRSRWNHQRRSSAVSRDEGARGMRL